MRRQTRSLTFRHQRGFTLLELMLVIGIASAVMIMTFQEKEREMTYARAQQLGVELYQYNNAVRSWLAVNANDASAHGTYTGTAWLKSTACGGLIDDSAPGDSAFLACQFPDQTRFGALTYTTVVGSDADDFETDAGRECAAMGGVVCAETHMPPVLSRGEPAPDLAGLAAITAAGGTASNLIPTFAATDGLFNSDPATARVTMLSSTNGGNDAWLRIDGSNRMAGGISWINDDRSEAGRADGSVSAPDWQREIRGASRIYNVSGAALRLGRFSLDAGGSPADGLWNPGVIVDTDLEVLGDLEVRGYARIDEDLDVGGIADVLDSVTSPRYYGRNSAGRVNSRYLEPTGESVIDAITAHGVIRGNDIAARTAAGLTIDGRNNLNLGSRDMRFEAARDLLVDAGRNATVSADNDLTIEGDRVLADGNQGWMRFNELAFSRTGDLRTSTALRGTVDVSRLHVTTRNGRTVPMSMLFPSYVHIATFRVSNGTLIGKPVCSTWGGVPRIKVTPGSQRFDVTATGQTAAGRSRRGQIWAFAENAPATLASSYWVVRASDQVGGHTGQVTADVYCEF
ncbi:prepilin-type N-terminal cleavage/methylation domain-containing protein [Natronocella acetinitrilica]|uniref:Prepilin-type N-terminal cleavage/methylation domain-containing protein n=1 Tax=Natronocella acetinitrilica TaxID=414046 RepID=A0AAE3G3V7_9GAMM|nr:prepilin-type N-terminal cleavage/methylation domain-containing protein [Natronocella acetinitrilica]MCP1674261.1 prepilin-type N-terminal cleavage/methylation domain-containing protein [Natronocella acetinitrilica]